MCEKNKKIEIKTVQMFFNQSLDTKTAPAPLQGFKFSSPGFDVGYFTNQEQLWKIQTIDFSWDIQASLPNPQLLKQNTFRFGLEIGLQIGGNTGLFESSYFPNPSSWFEQKKFFLQFDNTKKKYDFRNGNLFAMGIKDWFLNYYCETTGSGLIGGSFQCTVTFNLTREIQTLF
jgi:hypothetical protein